MKKQLIAAIMTTALTACASGADDIKPMYVSPLQYSNYDCDQLHMEYMRIQRRATSVYGNQNEEATGDAVAMGVGLVLFWPALFFLIGDDQKEEVARLKGEIEALEQASIEKKCYGLSEQFEADRLRAEEEAAAKAEARDNRPKARR